MLGTFRTFRNMQMLAAATSVVIATMFGTGVSRADDLATLEFVNTLPQDIMLDVSDDNPYATGMRHIGLGRPLIDGKPSHLAYNAPFKTPKDKKGNIKLKVTVHCGSSTDSVTYTRPPAGGKIRVTIGCKLTRP
jgi:hypothetical protein